MILSPGAPPTVEWSESEDVAVVVEIASRSTRVTDRTLKAAKYAEAGIPSYWRVDADGTVTIHTAPADDDYTQSAVVRPGERVLIEQPFPVELAPVDLVD